MLGKSVTVKKSVQPNFDYSLFSSGSVTLFKKRNLTRRLNTDIIKVIVKVIAILSFSKDKILETKNFVQKRTTRRTQRTGKC